MKDIIILDKIVEVLKEWIGDFGVYEKYVLLEKSDTGKRCAVLIKTDKVDWARILIIN